MLLPCSSAPADFVGVPLDLKNSLRTQKQREATKGYWRRVKKVEGHLADRLGITMGELRDMRWQVLEQQARCADEDMVDIDDEDGLALNLR